MIGNFQHWISFYSRKLCAPGSEGGQAGEGRGRQARQTEDRSGRCSGRVDAVQTVLHSEGARRPRQSGRGQEEGT